MKRLVPLAFLIWSCAHTDQTSAEKSQKSEPEAVKQPAEQKPAPPKPRPKSESGITLSDSPEASLTPHGFESLEQALVVRRFLDRARPHFDEAVKDALAKFQQGEGLPRTGMPDRETVRRLGLNVDDVFRK